MSALAVRKISSTEQTLHAGTHVPPHTPTHPGGGGGATAESVAVEILSQIASNVDDRNAAHRSHDWRLSIRGSVLPVMAKLFPCNSTRGNKNDPETGSKNGRFQGSSRKTVIKRKAHQYAHQATCTLLLPPMSSTHTKDLLTRDSSGHSGVLWGGLIT